MLNLLKGRDLYKVFSFCLSLHVNTSLNANIREDCSREIFTMFYEEDGKTRPKSLIKIWLSFIREIKDLEEMGSLRKKVGIRK